MIELPRDGSERILTIRLSKSTGLTNIVGVYALTLQATPNIKDTFFKEINISTKNIPTTEPVFILRDFNARIGADHELWPSVLGHHGIGMMTYF